MGLFTRKKSSEKVVEPDGAKGVTFADEFQGTISTWGWPGAYAYGLMYRRQPAVRTVVDFLSRNIAQLSLKVYLRTDHSDRLELDDHPLAQLLRAPNPTTSRFAFMRDTVADKAIHDRAYWLLDRPLYPKAVIRIPPDRMLRRIQDGGVAYFSPNGEKIPRNQLVVFSGYSPEGSWWNEDGVSPLETLRQVLAEEWQAQQYRENLWRNAARQSGVISRPLAAPEWSDSARSRFREGWEEATAGVQNSGRTAILEEGMSWSADSFSPKDSEYIAGRELAFEEVCRQYGVAPKLFGMGDIANANIDAFHLQLYQDTLGPWLKDIQDDIELQLLPAVETARGSRVYSEFNLAAKLAGSFEEQARTLTTSVGVPWMAGNEARSRLNLPRIDDPAFDVPVKPLNVLYGGQPAVTIPTEVPQPKRRTKATPPASVVRRRDEAAKSHTELFRRYFRAQRQAIGKTRAKGAPFDMDRWNAKLTGELYAARTTLAKKTGQLAARQIGGVYNEAQTLNFLQESARRQAEAVNKQTADALDAADDPEAEAAVFDEATTSRADYLGLSTATAVIGFARTEAGKQSQAADGRQRTKTWIVTSAKSRHPEMDGETVGIDEDFSIGLPWPGAASGDADQTAGCQCLLQMDTA